MSGLLMDVIGTLSSSQSNEQRDREKAKLEREFKLSDKRLEQLVTTHHVNLAQVMRTFGTASARLNEARARITAVKGQLAACRSLLHCKRDELKKLWLEGVEQKEILNLLDQVEEIKDLPDQVTHFISHKKYLKAAQLLQVARNRLQGPLATIEALKEVKADLDAKEMKLYSLLMEDLSNSIYVKPCTEVLQWKRLQATQTPFQRASGRGSSQHYASGSQKIRNDYLKANPVTLEIVTNNQTNNDGEDSVSFVSNIVQCLKLLDKMTDALETLKTNMAKDLGMIVSKSVQQVSEMYPTTPTGSAPLQYLVTALIEQMKRVVQTHSVLLNCVKSSGSSGHVEGPLYTKEDVWSQIQTVIQLLLSQYLDVGHASSTVGSSGSLTAGSQMAMTDLNAHFAKRRPNKPQKSALFRFEGSLQSMSLSSYLKETTGTNGESQYHGEDGGVKGTLVEPSVRHIIAVYQPLLEFIEEIEKDIQCPPGTHCALHSFVTDFTRDVFLGQIHVELATSLEEATRKLDTWKALTNPEALKNLKSSRPLLQSTVQVHQCVSELRQLMQSLPQFFGHFLGMACSSLLNYCETCQAAYRGLVQPESEDKRVISATWAKDEDINRFLRSLASWTALQSMRHGSSSAETYDESPEEINQRSAKETEILTGNLGDAVIPPHEILGDPMQLRILALLQESLEWFAGFIEEFAHSITRSSAAESFPAVPESNVQTLHQISRDFEDLADTCLLVLHLEVRMHCFYHLVPLGLHAQFWLAGDNQEPDPEIGRLSRDLTAIDEALGAYLQPRKLKYVFEGVSHLVASILISSVQHIRRVNENGVKKMCRNIFSVQQTLTSITLAREPALDHARQYFELLCLTPEEILNGIMERGAHYTELEYVQILQLLHRSRPGSTPADVTRHLERLSEILGELGVTV